MNDKLENDLKTIGTVEFSRTAKQYAVMREAVDNNICPFCPPQINSERFQRELIEERQNWMAKINISPYKHHRTHLVFPLKRHTNDATTITNEEWSELGSLLQNTIQKYSVQGGGIPMRFGLSDYNASTVRHLHPHLQEPDHTVMQNYWKNNKLHPEKQFQDDSQLIKSNDFWDLIRPNNKPPFHLDFLYIAPKKFLLDIMMITHDMWASLGEIFSLAVEKLKLPGGGFTLRFGSRILTNGINDQIYATIQVPDLNGPVRAILLGKEPEPICKATFRKVLTPEEGKKTIPFDKFSKQYPYMKIYIKAK